MEKEFDLSCIRVGTDHDLADAMALAARLLDETSANMDFVSRKFSFDLLVAVLMSTAYGTRDKTLAEVLLYLVDPSWDSPRQILLSFSQEREAWKQPSASKWRKGLTGKLEMVNDDAVAPQIKRCYMDWKIAFALGTVGGAGRRQTGIEVFDPQAVAKAVQMVSGLTADKKSCSERILQNAQANDGYRVVPDARKARAKLEEAKARFENLVEPIASLQ